MKCHRRVRGTIRLSTKDRIYSEGIVFHLAYTVAIPGEQKRRSTRNVSCLEEEDEQGALPLLSLCGSPNGDTRSSSRAKILAVRQKREEGE